jgi:type IV pilus assembly protein PilW
MGGFTLIELMISLTLGLIVIGAVSAFAVSSVRAYSENIQSSRMTQDLRTSMTLLVREMRRAGYDATSVSRVLTDTNPSQFGLPVVSGECVIYQYDRGEPGAAPAATETRGLRRNAATGTLQMNATSATPSCTSNDGWVDLTDPGVVTFTRFTPTVVNTNFCSQLGERTDPATGATVYDLATGSVRTLSLCLRGRASRDTTIERYVADSVRIRAENVQFISGAASATCSTAPGALQTVSALNTACAQ